MGKNDKIVVLVAEGCPACSQLKGEIGNDKRFKLMDVTSDPEAKKLAHDLDVHAVPTFLHGNRRGELCVVDDDGKVGKCIKEKHSHDQK